ncbi:uncharacterized protein LOC144102410 [Amblyomma americanum]
MARKPDPVTSDRCFSSAMTARSKLQPRCETGSPGNKEAPAIRNDRKIGNFPRECGCLIFRLLLAAVLTTEGSQAFQLEDGDSYDIVNSSVPNPVVRLVVSDQSRFAATVILTQEELNGQLKFEYLDPIKGKVIPPLVIKK